MNIVRRKPITFAVISLLAVSLIYSSSYTFYSFAAPKDSRFDTGECTNNPETLSATCCWVENTEPGNPKVITRVCQTCYIDLGTGEFFNCDPPTARFVPTGNLPLLETVPPNRSLPSGGDVPTLEQVPQEPGTIEAPGAGGNIICTLGGGCHPRPPPPPPPPPSEPVPNHVVQQTPPIGGGLAEQGLPELVPTCLEGQELDEETNLCVPVESQGVEQPEVQQLEPEEEPEEEQSEPEEEQPSEESDSSDDGSSNSN